MFESFERSKTILCVYSESYDAPSLFYCVCLIIQGTKWISKHFAKASGRFLLPKLFEVSKN